MSRALYQKGTITKVNKLNPQWAGRHLEYTVDEQGKRHRRQRTVRLGYCSKMTYRQAERKHAEILVKINEGPSSEVTVEQAGKKWLKEKVAYMKPASQNSLKSRLKHAVDAFGKQECGKVRAADIDTWVNGLLTRYEWKTVKDIAATFHMLWWHVEGWGFASHDPFHRFDMPKRNGSPEQPCFTLEQVREIISLAGDGCAKNDEGIHRGRVTNEQRDDQRSNANRPSIGFESRPSSDFQLMFRVLAETGQRGGEVCGLFTGDVDLEARTITIRRSAYQGRVQSPKTVNAVRTVHISSFLTGYLKDYLENGRRTPEAEPGPENISQQLLFPFYESWKGLAWDCADVVEYGLKPVLRKLGIDGPRVGLHAFRHHNKSLMLHLGVPEKYRNERSGHSSGTGKMDLVYSHTDVARHKEYAEMIGRELFARTESEQTAYAVGAD